MDSLKSTVYNLLRRSESFFKTDMVYLVKGGSWLGFSQIISTGSALILSVAFANLLPAETYGTYKYILSLVTLLAIPTLSGMDSAITRAVARGYEATVYMGQQIKLKWGSISFFTGIALSLYYFTNGNQILSIGFLIASICVPLWESFDIYNAVLNGKKLFNTYAHYYAVVQIISSSIVFLSLFWSHNLIYILIGYFGSNTLLRIFFYYYTLKKIPINTSADPEALSYGKHLSFMDVIGTVLGQIDKVLIFHYLGAVELALYTIAIAPTEQIKGVLKSIHTLALPRFAEREKEDLRSAIFGKTLRLGIFVTAVIGIYIIGAPYFYQIFFPKYLDAVIYSQVIALSLVGATLSMFLYTFLESHGQQKQMYQFNIYSNIINIGIVFIMIYFYGLWGAILARLIIRTLLLLYSIYLVKIT